jgi:hypothetical protein
MRRLGGTHLDRQRSLLPADYAVDPHRFGHDPRLRFHVPPGGDARSMEIARIQHQLVLAWRQHPEAPSGAALARRFGFSKQTLSRAVLGQRWMGETVMAALLSALRTSRSSESR